MYKHSDYCTHIKNKEDVDILTRPSFDVNIRLLTSSPKYKKVIDSCADLILFGATEIKEGYKPPHGWSGPNAGIPLNIIAVLGEVYYNPVIIKKSAETRKVFSNCGSLTLETPIEVVRHLWIDLSYYDRNGTQKQWYGIPPIPGFTIQHEVAHLRGELIEPNIARYKDI